MKILFRQERKRTVLPLFLERRAWGPSCVFSPVCFLLEMCCSLLDSHVKVWGYEVWGVRWYSSDFLHSDYVSWHCIGNIEGGSTREWHENTQAIRIQITSVAVASCFLPPPVPHARPFKALWWYFPEIIHHHHHPRNPKLHSSRPNVSAHMWYCLLYGICRLSPPLFCFPSGDHWWWPHPLLPRESGRNATRWSTPRELQKTKIGRKIASRLQNRSCWDLLPEDQYETRFQDWCTTIMQLCGARIIEDTCLIMFAQSLRCFQK